MLGLSGYSYSSNENILTGEKIFFDIFYKINDFNSYEEIKKKVEISNNNKELSESQKQLFQEMLVKESYNNYFFEDFFILLNKMKEDNGFFLPFRKNSKSLFSQLALNKYISKLEGVMFCVNSTQINELLEKIQNLKVKNKTKNIFKFYENDEKIEIHAGHYILNMIFAEGRGFDNCEKEAKNFHEKIVKGNHNYKCSKALKGAIFYGVLLGGDFQDNLKKYDLLDSNTMLGLLQLSYENNKFNFVEDIKNISKNIEVNIYLKQILEIVKDNNITLSFENKKIIKNIFYYNQSDLHSYELALDAFSSDMDIYFFNLIFERNDSLRAKVNLLKERIKFVEEDIFLITPKGEENLENFIIKNNKSYSSFPTSDNLFFNILNFGMDKIPSYSSEFWFLFKFGLLAAKKIGLAPKNEDNYEEERHRFFFNFAELMEKKKKKVPFIEKKFKFLGKTFKLKENFFNYVDVFPETKKTSKEDFYDLTHNLIEEMSTKKYESLPSIRISRYSFLTPFEFSECLKKMLLNGEYDRFIESENEGACQKMQTILSYSLTLNSEINNEGELDDRNSFLLGFFKGMQSCSGGMLETISAFYNIAEKNMINSLENNDPEKKLRALLCNYHRTLFAGTSDLIADVLKKNEEISNHSEYLSHYNSIIRSLIGEEIGIVPQNSQPEYDQALWEVHVERFFNTVDKANLLQLFMKNYSITKCLNYLKFQGKYEGGFKDIIEEMIKYKMIEEIK